MATENYALDQAKAQLSSIVEMVAALNVDYYRLEELKDELDILKSDVADELGTPTDLVIAQEALDLWLEENATELAELRDAAGDNESEDDARETIQEDALDVQVRSDWYSPGSGDAAVPSEFMILLCTGGPAVRIMGDLDGYGTPSRAYIQYQDWGTPWTDYVGHGESEALLTYCQQFYFGE